MRKIGGFLGKNGKVMSLQALHTFEKCATLYFERDKFFEIYQSCKGGAALKGAPPSICYKKGHLKKKILL